MAKASYILHQFVLVGLNKIKILQDKGQQLGEQGFIFKNKKRH